jgi:PAS domain S-box-containing protein
MSKRVRESTSQADRIANESSERLKALVEVVADYYWELDEETNVSWVSPNFTSLLHEMGVDFMGRPIARIVADLESNSVISGGWDKVLALIDTKKAYNDIHVFLQYEGMDRVDWSCTSTPIYTDAGSFKGMRGAAIDISRRTEDERTLHMQSIVLQGMEDGVVIIASDNRIVEVNPAYCKIFGLSEDELVGTYSSDLALKIRLPEDDLSAIARSLDQDGHWKRELEIETDSGDVKHVYGIGFQLNPSDKADNSRVSILRDITERKEAEQKLRLSEQRFRDVVAASSDLIWETNADDQLTYISDWLEESTGLARQPLIGHTIESFHKEQRAAEGGAQLAQLIKRRKPFRNHLTSTTYRNGKTIHRAASAAPYYDENGDYAGFRGLSRDITEQVSAEEQLRQAHRMEAVGQLTGGVAHDFNNILMSMQLNLELLEPLVPGDGEGPEFVETLNRGIGRAADLTSRLLAFSRQQVLQPKLIDVNSQIAEVLTILNRTLSEGITIDTDFTDEVAEAVVDPGQLENAIMNLTLNAQDAMPDGGQMIVATENISLGVKDMQGNGNIVPGNYLVVSVRDNGIGMAPEIAAQAFEPFFTTKEVGQGSGLGLSMVHGFVEQSRGYTRIESTPGKATTVKMFFPRNH